MRPFIGKWNRIKESVATANARADVLSIALYGAFAYSLWESVSQKETFAHFVYICVTAGRETGKSNH